MKIESDNDTNCTLDEAVIFRENLKAAWFLYYPKETLMLLNQLVLSDIDITYPVEIAEAINKFRSCVPPSGFLRHSKEISAVLEKIKKINSYERHKIMQVLLSYDVFYMSEIDYILNTVFITLEV